MALSFSITTSGASGVGPWWVCFYIDPASVTSDETTDGFHEINYRWNFDDAGGDNKGNVNWRYGIERRRTGGSRNTASGPVAGHMFEPVWGSGQQTYTVTCTGFDGVTFHTEEVTITVEDPLEYYAAANGGTIYAIGQTTLPVAGVDGVPSGATCVTQSNWNTIVSTYKGTKHLILLKHDDIFTGTANATFSVTGPCMFSMYGTGAKPELRITGTTSSDAFGLLNGTIRDLVFQDLNINGELNGNRQAFAASAGNLSRIWWHRVDIHDIGAGISIEETQTNTVPPDRFAAVDCTFENFNSVGGSNNSAGLRFTCSNMGVLGCLLRDTVDGAAEQIMRHHWIHKGVISNNSSDTGHTAAPGNKELWSIRSVDTTPGWWGESGDAIATKYVVISENRIEGDTYTAIDITYSAGGADNTIWRDIILEKNHFTTADASGEAIRFKGTHHTARNNICDMSDASEYGFGIGMNTGSFDNPDNYGLYHNTFYSGTTGLLDAIRVVNGSADIFSRNNLAWQPAASSGAVVVGGTESNNSTDAEFIAAGPNPPGFVSSTPVAAADFELGATSTKIGAGTAVPVWDDFNGDRRDPGSIDLGAFAFAPLEWPDAEQPAVGVALQESAWVFMHPVSNKLRVTRF